MKSFYQRGSIMGFIVIGATLAVLLIGGNYYVRHYLSASDVSLESSDDIKNDSGQSNENQNDSEGQEEQLILPSDKENSFDESTGLPRTGPTDTMASAGAVAFLAGAATYFMRSKQH